MVRKCYRIEKRQYDHTITSQHIKKKPYLVEKLRTWTYYNALR